MIKVLQVVHSLPVAGTEVLVAKLAEHLRPEFETAVCCLDSKGELADILKEKDIPVFNLERKPGIDLGAVHRFRQVLKAYPVNIIHAHQYTPFFYSALAKKRGVKLLFTEHGRHYPDIVSLKRRLFNQILKWRADWVGAVCEFSRKKLIELEGFTNKKIEIVYNGVPSVEADYSDPVKTREELGIPTNKKLIGCIGRLHPIKNPNLLLAAFKRAIQKNDCIHLAFVGAGELRFELEKNVEESHLEKHVTFCGEKFPVHPYLKMFDLFVLPSLSEGLSVTLLEAMAAKVPVLVTDVGGNRECVEDGVSGLIVKSNDQEVMTNEILKVWKEPQKLQEMAEKAYERVQNEFLEEKMIEKYREIYRRYSPIDHRQ